jgi:hypothetical protein
MHSDQIAAITAITIVAIIGGTLISLVKLWTQRRRGDDAGPTQKQLQAIEERLSRMEQAIESVAIETERISEGQRFTARVLAERAGQRLEGAPDRIAR